MISVNDHRELQAAVLAMKAMDRSLKKDINQATRDTMNPVWKGLVQANATSEFDTKLLTPGTRINAGNPPRAVAASSTRKVGARGRKNPLTPAEYYWLAEFGGRNNSYSSYKRKSKNGGTHDVKRRTSTGLPPRIRAGRAVYPAFAEIGPRMVSLWVQLIIKKTYDALESR